MGDVGRKGWPGSAGSATRVQLRLFAPPPLPCPRGQQHQIGTDALLLCSCSSLPLSPASCDITPISLFLLRRLVRDPAPNLARCARTLPSVVAPPADLLPSPRHHQPRLSCSRRYPTPSARASAAGTTSLATRTRASLLTSPHLARVSPTDSTCRAVLLARAREPPQGHQGLCVVPDGDARLVGVCAAAHLCTHGPDRAGRVLDEPDGGRARLRHDPRLHGRLCASLALPSWALPAF